MAPRMMPSGTRPCSVQLIAWRAAKLMVSSWRASSERRREEPVKKTWGGREGLSPAGSPGKVMCTVVPTPGWLTMLDGPAEAVREPAHDAQAHAVAAAPVALAPHEGPEHLFDLLRRDADAGVADADLAVTDLHHHLAGVCIRKRISQQVAEQDGQHFLRRVDEHAMRAAHLGGRPACPSASSFARSISSAMRSLTQMASMGRPVSDSRASSRKALVSSSMSWQARWMRCAVRRLRIAEIRIFEQDARGHADDRERTAQLVAGVARELAFALQEMREASRVAQQRLGELAHLFVSILGNLQRLHTCDVGRRRLRARAPCAPARSSATPRAASVGSPARSTRTARAARRRAVPGRNTPRAGSHWCGRRPGTAAVRRVR